MANQTELLNVSDEMKLDKDRQNLCEELSAGELCSSSLDTTEELYSSSVPDTCGDGVFTVKETLSLCGLADFFCEYVPVLLGDENVHNNVRVQIF